MKIPIDKLIEMAGNFADEFNISDEIEIEIDSKTKGALEKLVVLLEKDEENALPEKATLPL